MAQKRRDSHSVLDTAPLARSVQLRQIPYWSKSMRSNLAFGLMIAVNASADAATMRHSTARHHLFVNPNVVSSFDVVTPGWNFAPADETDTPSCNDPSKSGGSTALPIGG
jgi:hypothetical protein